MAVFVAARVLARRAVWSSPAAGRLAGATPLPYTSTPPRAQAYEARANHAPKKGIPHRADQNQKVVRQPQKLLHNGPRGKSVIPRRGPAGSEVRPPQELLATGLASKGAHRADSWYEGCWGLHTQQTVHYRLPSQHAKRERHIHENCTSQTNDPQP